MMMQVPSLASLSGLRIWLCHELCHRPAAGALIRPLPLELLYATDAAPQKQTNKQINKKKTKKTQLLGMSDKENKGMSEMKMSAVDLDIHN